MYLREEGGREMSLEEKTLEVKDYLQHHPRIDGYMWGGCQPLSNETLQGLQGLLGSDFRVTFSSDPEARGFTVFRVRA
jgi:hypothetical protein